MSPFTLLFCPLNSLFPFTTRQSKHGPYCLTTNKPNPGLIDPKGIGYLTGRQLRSRRPPEPGELFHPPVGSTLPDRSHLVSTGLGLAGWPRRRGSVCVSGVQLRQSSSSDRTRTYEHQFRFTVSLNSNSWSKKTAQQHSCKSLPESYPLGEYPSLMVLKSHSDWRQRICTASIGV